MYSVNTETSLAHASIPTNFPLFISSPNGCSTPTQNKAPWESPGGLVVRTALSLPRPGSIPGREAQILQATPSVAKNNNKSKPLCGENVRVEETKPPLSRVQGAPGPPQGGWQIGWCRPHWPQGCGNLLPLHSSLQGQNICCLDFSATYFNT